MKDLRFPLSKIPGLSFLAFLIFGVAVALCTNSCGQQINVMDLTIAVLVSAVLAAAGSLTGGLPGPGYFSRSRQ